jgi:stress-induced morphogen
VTAKLPTTQQTTLNYMTNNNISLSPIRSFSSKNTQNSPISNKTSFLSKNAPFSISKHSFSSAPEEESRDILMHKLITKDFSPLFIDIKDTSGGCGAFYQITVVSEAFQGKMTLARHRAVQTTLKDIIPHIHGLNLFTHTPKQWEDLQQNKSSI